MIAGNSNEPRTRFEDGVRIMLENIEGWRTRPCGRRENRRATADWFRYLGRREKPGVTKIWAMDFRRNRVARPQQVCRLILIVMTHGT